MKKFLFIFLLSGLSIKVNSQIDSFFVSASKSVVYLFGECPKSAADTTKIQSAGTGFFVHYRNNLYIVTAEHVAKSLQHNQKLIFNDSANIPITLKLSDVVNSDTIIWTINPDADVAVLVIHPESKLGLYIDFKANDISWLEDKLVAPGRYKEAICFGFPLSLGIQNHFSPISTSSKIASDIIDLPRFDTKKISSFFILDEPSIPGLSGGPVFRLPSFLNSYDSATIIGLVHGVISDNTGGKFAAIVPSSFIVETIKKTKRFTGIYKIFYPNGKLWSEHLYDDGFFMEVLSNYGPMGKPQDKGTLKDGSGTLKLYDEKGKLMVIDYFENKKYIKREFVK